MRSIRATLLLSLLTVSTVACPHPRKPSVDQPKAFVPWTATLPTQSPPSEPIGVPSGTKACSASMLRFAAFGAGGAAAGTYYTSAGVVNVTSKACFVDRRSTVRFLDARGRAVQPRIAVDIEPDSGVVVPPGSKARALIRLGASNVCPPPPASTMEVTFAPGGTRRRIDLQPGLGSPSPGPDCGTGPGSYFAAFVAESPPEPEPPPSPLTASIKTYTSARAGSRFRYFVLLSNPSSAAVALDPCPIYVESLKAKGGFGVYVLNCSSVRSIPAHESVTYEMFIDVPAGITGDAQGRVFLTWGFDGNTGPSTSALIKLS